MDQTSIQLAIAAAGGQTALARKLSSPGRQIRQGHVWDWARKRRIPPEFVPKIEHHTGVRCEELRPDLGWERDEEGRVVAYVVPLPPIEKGEA